MLPPFRLPLEINAGRVKSGRKSAVSAEATSPVEFSRRLSACEWR
jgi:hypothetical protein